MDAVIDANDRSSSGWRQGRGALAGPRPRRTAGPAAHLLAEDRQPPESLWRETLVSSSLLEYEAWTRIHARRLAKSHGDALRAVLGRVARIELVGEVLVRARERFPVEVRTLDVLHLASMQFLVDQGQSVALATYDRRMLNAARRLKLDTYPLERSRS